MKKLQLFSGISGQGIVEFVVVVPIMLSMIFAMVDLSRFVYHKTLLNQTTGEIVRMASLGTDLNSILLELKNMVNPIMGNASSASSSGVDDEGNQCTQITLSSTGYSMKAYITPKYTTSLVVGSTLRVAVFYQMKYITPMSTIFGETVNLEAIYYTNIEVVPK